MDIRSLLESDSPTSAQARPAKQSQQQPERTFQGSFGVLPPTSRSAHGGTRPPQPPPLQPPSQMQSHVELPSPSLSSYASIQSPYQQTPSSTMSGGQYPFPQALSHSPGHGFKPSPYGHQENHSNLMGGYGPSTPINTAPEHSHVYPHQPRQHSIHSLTTPTSAQSQQSNFQRMSPQAVQPQVRALSQSHPTQQYHSQPGTPLGPPASYSRPTPSLHKEQTGSFEHRRSHSGNSYSHPQLTASSPRIDPPGSSAGSPRDYEPRRQHPKIHHVSNHGDRERSLSVSPKTKVFIQPQGRHLPGNPQAAQAAQSWDAQVIPAKRQLGEESWTDHVTYPTPERVGQSPARSRSLAVNGMLNAPPTDDRTIDLGAPSPTKQNIVNFPPPAKTEAKLSSDPSQEPQEPRDFSTSRPPAETQIDPPISKLPLPGYLKSPSSHTGQRLPLPLNMTLASDSPATSQNSTMQQFANSDSAVTRTSVHPLQTPIQKKRRPTEIPIYARSSRAANKIVGAFRQQHFSVERAGTSGKQESGNPTDSSTLGPQTSATPATGKQELKHDANGNVPLLPKAQPIFADNGPLGPWESSIVNVIPSEEMTRVISDFLFTEVVRREDVGAGPAGGAIGMGAVLEIEAKIGQLIDKNTNERLRLPVKSECVLNPHDPNLRITFKSSMTEVRSTQIDFTSLTNSLMQAQHRSLNQFLNTAFLNSKHSKPQPGARSRIPMSYVHTFERDSFFDLSQSGILSLPASIRAQLNPRQPKAKIRVTTEHKTGKEISKIIKARVADLDIHSPCTAFDWRVSVNIEMNIDGDLSTKVEPSSMDGKRPERNKDRVSYRHLAYQIDLTQVTPSVVS